MNQTSSNLEASVVAVCNSTGAIFGAGFVVSKRLIVTCAHVVIAAGGEPGKTVLVKFHLNGETCKAQVDDKHWLSPDHGDVAVLQLEDVLPAGVVPVVLCNAAGSDGHPFHAFGYPEMGTIEGIHATGKIEGMVNEVNGRQLIQLTSQNIAPGVSGGPVLDESRSQVVGMVTSAYFATAVAKHRDTAFATPIETLFKGCPELIELCDPAVNPFYTNGRINDPSMFFGRKRLIREIRIELKKRCSVSLVGNSQIGKSSLLYYLYATRAEWLPDVALEYIDLQGVLDEGDFCETVLKKLGANGSTLLQLKHMIETREVILLLDEVERIAEQDFNPRLHDLLRSLGQTPNFAMCVATQQPLDIVFPPRTFGSLSPFHNIFTHKSIGLFTESEARMFLAARLANTSVSFTDREIERLLAESQYHPAKLQRLAKELFELYVCDL
jgi:hypothetical protein